MSNSHQLTPGRLTPGLLLKVARVSRCLQQEEAAALLGVSQPTYSRLEAGRRLPGKQLRRRIREVFALAEEAWEEAAA